MPFGPKVQVCCPSPCLNSLCLTFPLARPPPSKLCQSVLPHTHSHSHSPTHISLIRTFLLPSHPLSTSSLPTKDNSTGKKSQNRTFTDLLKDDHDVALFDYYGTSQIATIDVKSGKVTTVGPPGLYVE
jgi:hypothetical protein